MLQWAGWPAHNGSSSSRAPPPKVARAAARCSAGNNTLVRCLLIPIDQWLAVVVLPWLTIINDDEFVESSNHDTDALRETKQRPQARILVVGCVLSGRTDGQRPIWNYPATPPHMGGKIRGARPEETGGACGWATRWGV